MHTFGKESEFEIKYQTLQEKFKDDSEIQNELSGNECWGEVQFIVKGKNLFDRRFENKDILETYIGNVFGILQFYCNNLYFQITDDRFPANTSSSIGAEMMYEMRLVEWPDNDISKYAEVDFDSLDMDLYAKVDVWNGRHGFVGNFSGNPLPYVYIQKSEDNKIEVSWNMATIHEADRGNYQFCHGKGVEYIDLKLYKDTVVSFCLDALDRLGKYMPMWEAQFRRELQKAIDVELEAV